VMNAGQIEQVGPPIALYQAPRTRFVLEFLGATNYLPAHISAPGAVAVPDANGALLEIPADADLAVGTIGRVSFRAEDVTLERVNGEADAWEAQIVSAAFLGNVVEYVVRLGDARVHATGPKYDPMPAGTHVKMRVRDGACSFWSDQGRN
jgi:iron(III) transport system ATP-binding protein